MGLTKSMLHKRVKITEGKYQEWNSECSVDEIDIESTSVIEKNKYRCHQVFTDKEEQCLYNYFLTSWKIHYKLAYLQARTLAFQYAEKLSKAIPNRWSVNECWLLTFNVDMSTTMLNRIIILLFHHIINFSTK